MKKILSALLSVIVTLAGLTVLPGCNAKIPEPVFTGDFVQSFYKSDAKDVSFAIDCFETKILSLSRESLLVSTYTYEGKTLVITKEYLAGLDSGLHSFVLTTDGGKVEFFITVEEDVPTSLEFSASHILTDFGIRDPFMFKDPKSDVYYLVCSSGASVIARRTRDLINFSSPVTLYKMPSKSEQYPNNPTGFWAPELHFYRGFYYIFVTYTYGNWPQRQTYIIRSAWVDSGYEELSDMTNPENFCLDGTLYVENGVPYGIYCDEWLTAPNQDGTIWYYELKPDLSDKIGNPYYMFKASDNKAVTPADDKVTDGCFMYRSKHGELFMLWSSFGKGKYLLTWARSSNGKITGSWIQATQEQALFSDDGGHGMVFNDLNGEPCVIFHTPNSSNAVLGYRETAVIYKLNDNVKGELKLGQKMITQAV